MTDYDKRGPDRVAWISLAIQRIGMNQAKVEVLDHEEWTPTNKSNT